MKWCAHRRKVRGLELDLLDRRLELDLLEPQRLGFLVAFRQSFLYFIKLNLLNLNSFTDTLPSAFRCNFKIYLNEGGFSSYQSEYPFEMTLKNGNIFSSVSTLLNNEAEENYILFRNIFHKPRIESFNIYFINIKTKKILKIEEAYSNTSNLIFVDKDLINEDVYIFSDSFLGIPIFISKNRNHLSMEHTHPPHHYIISNDKYQTVSKLKKKNLGLIDILQQDNKKEDVV